MTTGVPRGTVLSPLLYIIYVSELSKLNINGNLYSYADDLAMVIIENTRGCVVQKEEFSLKKFTVWFSKNNVLLNKDKTVFLTFSNAIGTTLKFVI